MPKQHIDRLQVRAEKKFVVRPCVQLGRDDRELSLPISLRCLDGHRRLSVDVLQPNMLAVNVQGLCIDL